MGWLSNLFKGKTAEIQQVKIHEVQALDLHSFLMPQLQLLGLEFEKVPAEGSFISKQSRGYIYGMAAAVLCETTEKQDSEMVDEMMQAAFTLAVGTGRRHHHSIPSQ